MKKSLGISLYLNDFDEDYLNNLKDVNVKYAFTSLHISEEDFDKDRLQKILTGVKRNNIKIIIDVSPNTLKKLEINDIKELKNIDVDTIRLDFGFDDLQYVKTLTENFQVVLNASVVKEDYILSLKEIGVDVSKLSVLHNFYPKKYTGLEVSSFAQKNKVFTKYNIENLAFIGGDLINRLPTYESLPTLEIHRGLPLVNAGLDLLFNHQVDGVLIGDGMCNTKNLKRLEELMYSQTLTIRTVGLNEEFLNNDYTIRADFNSQVIRLNTRNNSQVNQQNSIKPNKGSIMLTNNFYGRYNGEIEITTIDLEFDYRYNVIGYIHPEDLPLLEFIAHYKKIKFIKE